MRDPILITGGAGFIGTALITHLLRSTECQIVNLDRLTYAANQQWIESELNSPRHFFVKGDINDTELVQGLLSTHQPGAVVHLAAETHVDRSIDDPLPFVQTNVVGTVRLLECVWSYWKSLTEPGRQNFRFVHISTDEVFGSLPEDALPFHGASQHQPNSPYAASKASAEHFVRAYWNSYGLPTVTINCSNNYGPRQYPEKLVPLMIRKCLRGEPLPIYGNGRQRRDWIHVDDHARAIAAALNRGRSGTRYLVGANCERTNLEVVESICDIVDQLSPGLPHSPCQSLITFVRDRPGHDQRYAVDITATTTELEWQPTVEFDRGIEQSVRWYLENPQWYRLGDDDSGRLGLERALRQSPEGCL